MADSYWALLRASCLQSRRNFSIIQIERFRRRADNQEGGSIAVEVMAKSKNAPLATLKGWMDDLLMQSSIDGPC